MKRYLPSLLTVFLSFCSVITFFYARGYPQGKEEEEALQKLNINTATLEELSSLPKISIRNAKSIIRYREKHGSFKRMEDINKVPDCCGVNGWKSFEMGIGFTKIEPTDELKILSFVYNIIRS